MGYIAYAAGTLIAAAAIHSFITRKPTGDKEEVLVPTVTLDAPTIEHESESEQEDEVDPVVTIEFSHDGDGQTISKESTADGKTRVQVTSVQEKQVAPQIKEPVTNGHIPEPAPAVPPSKPQAPPSQLMPPPPPPIKPSSSSNPAAQARQRSAMPPPSSLPLSRARSPPRLKPATVSSLAPPLRGNPRQNVTGTGANTLSPPPSSVASLRVPTQKVLANTRMQPQSQSQSQSSLTPTTSTQPPSKRPSRKIILTPGHSPLDWAALANSPSPSAPTTLRGQDATSQLGPFRLGRITPSQLKRQNGRKGRDAWTVYQGRVYNISAYLEFHPGGEGELLRGAGRRSDELFAEVHPWVNWEGMLGGCCVGLLVGEEEGEEREEGDGGNELDEMD